MAELVDRVPAPHDVAATDAFIEEAKSRPETAKILTNYLNYHEGLAAGVNCGIFDLEVVYRVRGTTIIRLEELYRGYIREQRSATYHPEKYMEIQNLAESLREWEAVNRPEQSRFSDLRALETH